MRKPRQHDVIQRIQLLLNRIFNTRIIMPKQIHPPATHRIQIARAFRIVEPHAIATRNGNQRVSFMLLHLRAWMPHGLQTAG